MIIYSMFGGSGYCSDFDIIFFFFCLSLAQNFHLFLMIFVSQCIFRIFPKDATLPPQYQPKNIRPPNIFWDNLFQLFLEKLCSGLCKAGCFKSV